MQTIINLKRTRKFHIIPPEIVRLMENLKCFSGNDARGTASTYLGNIQCSHQLSLHRRQRSISKANYKVSRIRHRRLFP